MSSPTRARPAGEVVSLRTQRRASKSADVDRQTVETSPSDSAELLSIRQNLRYQAVIGVDDIDEIVTEHSVRAADEIMAAVRQLLDNEFGKLRVYRRRYVYVVGHPSLEGLIAGLLRVQFHGKQLMQTDESNNDPKGTGLSMSWGVGKTVADADNERLKRLGQRRS